MIRRSSSRGPLLVIVALLSLGLFKLASGVFLPIAAALFITILAVPLQQRLGSKLPHWAAFSITMAIVLGAGAGFIAGLAECLDELAEGSLRYRDQVVELLHRFEDAGAAVGLDLSSDGFGRSRVVSTAERALSISAELVAGLFLTVAFTALLLFEAPSWSRKLAQLSRAERGRDIDYLGLALRLTTNFRRYFATRTLTSALTGALTALVTWALGVDFPLVWGFSSFLLNYIPTIGSVVAVIPPALLAWLQHGSPILASAVLGSLGVIQLAIGSFVDPRLQSRFVGVSAFVVLASVALSGWVWGIPGALLGVPIAITFTLVGMEHDSTRVLAALVREDGAGLIRKDRTP